MAKFNFGGVEETVVTRDEFPPEKAREVLKNEVVAVLGYGVQGPAQALNMRDNGINVIVGQKEGSASWDKALADGWVPGETLFSIEEAAERGTILQYLLSDAGQRATWPRVSECLNEGDMLYFSHGFAMVYHDQTGVVPPPYVDVALVAPKGSGRSVRKNFLDGSGINASFAVRQDFTGRARERTLAIGIAIGVGYLFESSFEGEVYSDLTGERGVLMGALAGIMEAQYSVLPARHTPSGVQETVEELHSRSFTRRQAAWTGCIPTATAQRGALDWKGRFREAVAPVFDELYESVVSGKETAIVLAANSAPDYREKLDAELKEMRESEMWRTGAAVRSLRPENWRK
jgi:ketol-acid reductoisomerase